MKKKHLRPTVQRIIYMTLDCVRPTQFSVIRIIQCNIQCINQCNIRVWSAFLSILPMFLCYYCYAFIFHLYFTR